MRALDAFALLFILGGLGAIVYAAFLHSEPLGWLALGIAGILSGMTLYQVKK